MCIVVLLSGKVWKEQFGLFYFCIRSLELGMICLVETICAVPGPCREPRSSCLLVGPQMHKTIFEAAVMAVAIATGHKGPLLPTRVGAPIEVDSDSPFHEKQLGNCL